MQKTKTIKTFQRKTKSGKMTTVKEHSAKYDSAEDMAKEALLHKKGAGSELAKKKTLGTPLEEWQKRHDELPEGHPDKATAKKWVEHYSGKKSSDKKEPSTAKKNLASHKEIGTSTKDAKDIQKLKDNLNAGKYNKEKKPAKVMKTPKHIIAGDKAVAQKLAGKNPAHGVSADEYKAWYHWDMSKDPKNKAALSAEKKMKSHMGDKEYKKYFNNASENYSSRGHSTGYKSFDSIAKSFGKGKLPKATPAKPRYVGDAEEAKKQDRSRGIQQSKKPKEINAKELLKSHPGFKDMVSSEAYSHQQLIAKKLKPYREKLAELNKGRESKAKDAEKAKLIEKYKPLLNEFSATKEHTDHMAKTGKVSLADHLKKSGVEMTTVKKRGETSTKKEHPKSEQKKLTSKASDALYFLSGKTMKNNPKWVKQHDSHVKYLKDNYGTTSQKEINKMTSDHQNKQKVSALNKQIAEAQGKLSALSSKKVEPAPASTKNKEVVRTPEVKGAASKLPAKKESPKSETGTKSAERVQPKVNGYDSAGRKVAPKKEMSVAEAKANLRGKTHGDQESVFTAASGKTSSQRKEMVSAVDKLMDKRKKLKAAGKSTAAVEAEINKHMGWK